MANDLEAPPGSAPYVNSLYLARSEDVVVARPVFTGDVYLNVKTFDPVLCDWRNANVLVLQHPCSLRADGVNLIDALVVAEVSPFQPVSDWTKYGNYMPLPGLELEAGKPHSAATFKKLATIASSSLEESVRVACLSQPGVNVLMQRWVHYSSRVIVPTSKIDEVVAGPYEEAALLEEWTESYLDNGAPASLAARHCHDFLREDHAGTTRQKMLEDAQQRSTVRREARQHLKAITPQQWNEFSTPSGT